MIFRNIRKKLFNLVECRICDKLTEPSIMEGNICSFDCLFEEDKWRENK